MRWLLLMVVVVMMMIGDCMIAERRRRRGGRRRLSWRGRRVSLGRRGSLGLELGGLLAAEAARRDC